ncbi:MAG: acyl-ACP--UDP-N-acetylglucosamine O-acyltransferase [Pseudomonadota bacterium]
MLADDVVVGPLCVIEGPVVLGHGVILKSHVVIAGKTTIGDGSRIFPFASIGHEPQDLKYKGEETELVIGRNCLIREGVTINPGTVTGSGITKIGNNCAFLANSHVAHDCTVGDNVILSNGVLLAGHVTLGDNVIMGGSAAVHQFTRIGNHAFIGGLAGIENDVIPFGMALGNRAYLGGVNLVGMKRHDFPRESIHAVRQVFKLLFEESDGTLMARLDGLPDDLLADDQVQQIVGFIRAESGRSFCTPRQTRT